jgi:predicted metalloprotease
VGTLVIVVVALYFGVDPTVLLQGGGPGTGIPSGAPTRPSSNPSAADEQLKEFVSVVLADTEDTWHQLFREKGRAYREPKLVLFTGAVQSACGYAGSATGPFYCPADKKVYIDLGFYEELKHRFGAPGDFAQAYVIAHEIGHHVQNLLGVSDEVRKAQAGMGQTGANKLSVRLELQADCFAGLWAHHADRSRGILESGDLEEALRAAEAIGDDRLQMQSKGYVAPDSFTHGTSAERKHWFDNGFRTGKLSACNTFDSAAAHVE